MFLEVVVGVSESRSRFGGPKRVEVCAGLSCLLLSSAAASFTFRVCGVLPNIMRRRTFELCCPALSSPYIVAIVMFLSLCQLVVSTPRRAVGGVVLSVGRVVD